MLIDTSQFSYLIIYYMPDSTLSAVAGAIPVVGGIIGSLINNSNTDATNAANEAFQVQQQAQQNAYNVQNWQMQTDYNSPENVMNRYIAAGLNPNLIYGSGSGTGNLAEPIAPAAKVEYVQLPHPSVNGTELGASAVNAYNNVKLGSAQTNNLSAQTANTNEDTVLKSITASYLPDQQQSDINLKNADVGLKGNQEAGQQIANMYSADSLAASINKMKADTGLALNEAETSAVMRSPNLATALQSVVNMRTDNMRNQADISQIQANTKNLLASGLITQYQAGLTNQGISPHDGAFSRIVSGMLNKITGGMTSDLQTGKGAMGVTPPPHVFNSLRSQILNQPY